jgi:hypothetical protein
MRTTAFRVARPTPKSITTEEKRRATPLLVPRLGAMKRTVAPMVMTRIARIARPMYSLLQING